MPRPTHEQTLFVPKERVPSGIDRATTGLPPDLLNRAATRLQILAWLYAFTFFVAGFFAQFLVLPVRQVLFERVVNWLPAVVSIAVAVAVALAVRMVRLRPAAVTVLALVFEVVCSYGIAAGEFLQPLALSVDTTWVGLSWVAVWVLLFNVVVPTVPRYAVLAALMSVTSVPVMVLLSTSMFPLVSRPSAAMIFLAFGLPYLLVVFMAYIGARVVYALGAEVTRARELGSYRLEERLGEGGMGEVWRASHRLLARPAAIKLIRSSAAGHAAGDSDDMRRRFEREAQVIAQLRSAPHGNAVRLRRYSGGLVLIRHGAARRTRYRHAHQALRPDAGRTRRPHPSADVPFTVGGRIVRARAPRHQAGKRLLVPSVRRGPRLRESSRFRDRDGRARTVGRGRDSHHDAQPGSRHAGVHCTGTSTGRHGGRHPRRHLLDGLRGLLAPDRSARVHGRHRDEAAVGARAHAAGATILENQSPDPTGPGRAGAVLPREGS